MEGTGVNRSSTDIGATAIKNKDIIPHLLSAHALSGCDNLSEVRCDFWAKRMAKVKAAPELKSLPPTTEAFTENGTRAHIQATIWKSVTSDGSREIDPTRYGWTKNEFAKPIHLPQTVPVAPKDILELVRYGCSSDRPCLTAQCKCLGTRLACITCCHC